MPSAMRALRRAAVLFLLAIAASCATARREAIEARFTILQINDVYKIEGLEGGSVGGLGRVRTLRRQLEAEGRPVLVLLAGDLLFPSVMSKYLKGRPMIETLNILDGDPAAHDPRLVAVFGNHEFDDRDPGVLLGRAAQADFEWVSSNVRYRSSKDAAGAPFSARLQNVHETLVIELAGVRVGIFGLTTDAQPRDYVSFAYALPERRAAVRAALDRLKRDGARVIVALTHQDLEEDVRLASEFPEITVVVGGHEHFFLQRKVGGIWVTKADADAKSAVVHDVRVRGAAVETTPRKVVLGPETPSDPLIEAEVKTWMTELSRAVRSQTGRDPLEVVGTTENLLEGVEPAVRGRETALGNFLADVARERTQADLAFINGGAIRINDNIPPGPIRNYDLEGIFYFDNALTAFEMTGGQLLEVLRTSVAKVHVGHGRFLQVSGIRFRYKKSGTPEDPAYRIDPEDVVVRPRGASDFIPLDLGRRYAVASLDYLWENGCRDGYAVFSQGCGGASPARLDSGARLGWRAVTEEAIAALPGRRVTAKIEGRITAEE